MDTIPLAGGFAEFSSSFPGLCEGKSTLVPTCISQPCLPVSNIGPTRILPHLYLGCQRDVLNKVSVLDAVLFTWTSLWFLRVLVRAFIILHHYSYKTSEVDIDNSCLVHKPWKAVWEVVIYRPYNQTTCHVIWNWVSSFLHLRAADVVPFSVAYQPTANYQICH